MANSLFENANDVLVFSNSILLVAIFATISIVYIKYVHFIRRTNINDFVKRIPFPTNLEEAHKIVGTFYFQDFPFLSAKSFEYCLFKIYAIPLISNFLCKDGELTCEMNKFYDDIDIIFREIMEHNPSSLRAEAALKRMNSIRSQCKISNQESLYILSVFMVEPIALIEKYGYRDPHPEEKVAMYQYWKYIGEEIGIEDIPESLDKALEYCTLYQQKYMKYHNDNARLAKASIDLFLSNLPFKYLHEGFLHPMVHSFCPRLLREALGFPVNLSFQQFIFVQGILNLCSFIVKNLVVPESKWILRTGSSDDEYVATQFSGKNRKGGVCGRKLFTKFDVYKNTYKDGYLIEELGATNVP